MTTFALDSSAVVAWVLQEHPKWTVVDALLEAPGADPVLAGPALTEVIRVARARGNTSSGHQIARTLAANGMRLETSTEHDLVRAAELLELSASHPGPPHPRTSRRAKLSLGDGLILAAVERLDIPVVTNDKYWLQFASDGHTTASVQTL